MKYTIAFTVALLLLGCSGEQKSASTTAAPSESIVTKENHSAPQEVTKKVALQEEAVKEVTEKKAPEAQEVPLPGTTTAHKVATASSFNAKRTFNRKCGGCHGVSGEKPALGKSQIIEGWEASKVLTALQGYKDGSYGGAMKGLMASQVSALSQTDMEALAEHISKL